MTKREIAALACKIMSLYVIIGGLNSVTYFIAFLTFPSAFSSPLAGPSLPSRAALALSPFVLHTSFGVFLWLFADGIAATMVRDAQDQPEPAHSDWRAADLKAIAFSVVGLVTLVQGAVSLSGMLVSHFLGGYTPAPSQSQFGPIAAIASSTLQVVIGLWLLLGARRLVGMVGTVRDAVLHGPDGRPPPAPEGSPAPDDV